MTQRHVTRGFEFGNLGKVSNAVDGVDPQDYATMAQLAAVISGLEWKQQCRLATASALAANIYANGSSGVGATLTGTAFGSLSIDGVTPSVGDRILVKNEAAPANNGIYTVSVVGAIATLYVLTRSTDYDQAAEVVAGTATFVTEGTANSDTAWVQTTTGTITLGSTSLVFVQFGGGTGVSYATPAVVFGSSAAAGAASTVIRSDSTVAAFNLLGPVAQAFGDTSLTGSAAFAARQDHRHPMPATPVTAFSVSGSSSLTGAVTLTAGSNVSLTQSGNNIAIAATSTSGGASGVTSINKTGSTPITGSVTLSQGTNVTLTQSGSDISVATASANYIGFIILQDQQTANTAGGGFTSGSFATRVLNTEVLDSNNDCSLSSNQITLNAGTYDCDITAPAFFVNAHKTRLQNVTDTATVFLGTSEYSTGSGGGVQTISRIVGRFTIAASKALEVQHRCEVTHATNGLGVASNFGVTEIYTVARFWRVS